MSLRRKSWACDALRVAIALDTLAYARRLREAGFSEAQAEGQAEALAAAMTDTLATKQELHELQIRMEAGFASVKDSVREMELRLDARFDAKLADLERRVTVRMLAGIAAVSALVKLL